MGAPPTPPRSPTSTSWAEVHKQADHVAELAWIVDARDPNAMNSVYVLWMKIVRTYRCDGYTKTKLVEVVNVLEEKMDMADEAAQSKFRCMKERANSFMEDAGSFKYPAKNEVVQSRSCAVL